MNARAQATAAEIAAVGPRPAHDDYCPRFDYLRMLLALGVFAAHADRSGVLPPNLGELCVQVFFALSGFLIGGILLRSRAEDLPRFYFNRSTRIWVPYYAAIALLLGMTIVLRQPLHDAQLWQFVTYKATFVYNWFGVDQLATARAHMPLAGTGNHFWSICVEEQFYLVAPFLLVFARRIALPLFAGLIALNVVVPHLFAGVAAGVLLAHSRERLGPWHQHPTARLALTAFGLVGVVAALAKPGSLRAIEPLVATAIVALAATPGRPTAIGAFVGGISYPFYLDHWLGLFATKSLERHLHVGLFAASCGALAIALGFSAAHYALIDRRIQRVRSAYFTRSRGWLCCAAGVALVVAGIAFGISVRH